MRGIRLLPLTAALALLTAPSTPADMGTLNTDVMISEVQSRLVNLDDDLANAAEIHNPTGGGVDITGWTIEFYDSSQNLTASFTFPTYTIPAGGFVVVTAASYLPILCAQPDAEFHYSPTASDGLPDAGAVVLVDDSSSEVDRVGTVVGLSEGSPALQLNGLTDRFGMSITRDPLTDTDDNGDDFSRLPQGWGCG